MAERRTRQFFSIVNFFFSYLFRRGTSGIDIDLRRVDINQCPRGAQGDDDGGGGTLANIFMDTDKCKGTTRVSERERPSHLSTTFEYSMESIFFSPLRMMLLMAEWDVGRRAFGVHRAAINLRGVMKVCERAKNV